MGKERMVYICNKAFPSLGIEEEDYFPADKFSVEVINRMLKNGEIRKEVEIDEEKDYENLPF